MKKILIVDDDRDLLFVIEHILASNKYETQTAVSVNDGLLKYQSFRPDLMLIDRIMDGQDGLYLGKQIRQMDKDVKIIFLTSKTDVDDVVEGLTSGANDYVKKPFAMKELLARIQVALQNTQPKAENNVLEVGKYRLNTVTNVFSHDGKDIQLTTMEAELLRILIENKNRVVPSETLISYLWKEDKDFYTNANLHVYIHHVRNLFEGDTEIYLMNIRAVGYKLVEISEGEN